MFPGSFARFRSASKRWFSSSQAAAPRGLWEEYNGLLVSHPLSTKIITGGTLAVIADLVCQTSFPTAEVKDKPIAERINWRRTMNFGIINALFFPPIAHYWYGMLSVRIVGDTFAAALKRVALDQILFAPVCLTGFFSLNMILNGQMDAIPKKLEEDLLPTMVTNYSVWVPAQIINFKFVPIPMRVLWANLVGFFWNIYLSNAANTSSKAVAQPTETKDQQ